MCWIPSAKGGNWKSIRRRPEYVYSELPLFRASEMRSPHYCSHWRRHGLKTRSTQCKSNLWNAVTSIFRFPAAVFGPTSLFILIIQPKNLEMTRFPWLTAQRLPSRSGSVPRPHPPYHYLTVQPETNYWESASSGSRGRGFASLYEAYTVCWFASRLRAAARANTMAE